MNRQKAEERAFVFDKTKGGYIISVWHLRWLVRDLYREIEDLKNETEDHHDEIINEIASKTSYK